MRGRGDNTNRHTRKGGGRVDRVIIWTESWGRAGGADRADRHSKWVDRGSYGQTVEEGAGRGRGGA